MESYILVLEKCLFIWLCLTSCGILDPDQGTNLCLLHWNCRVLTTAANRNRLTDSENKSAFASQEEWGEERVREFGMDMYTLLYLTWITNKVLLYSTKNSAQCYVSAWMGGGVSGRMDTCLYMAEFLCCASETIATLFVN